MDTTTAADVEHLEATKRLGRDLAKAAATLSEQEARFLVDAYYMMQAQRIRSANQVRALGESNEPHAVLGWYMEQSEILERSVQRALDKYSAAQPLGEWARSVYGIGPVIAAGLLAHIDLSRAPHAGSVWRFAGLDPSIEWKKGEKRPFNASLKTLCWKIGESFVKVKGRDKDFYGHVYAGRRELLEQRNANGAFAEDAKAKLERFRIGKATAAYKHYASGHLPPGHVHARAKRYAVKLFLSHYHAVGTFLNTGSLPELPYAFAKLSGHGHLIAPPNMDAVPGLEAAWAEYAARASTESDDGR